MNRLKRLFWDDNGFVMVYKKIEKGKFVIPKTEGREKYLLDDREFQWLMQGVNWLLRRENEKKSHYYY